MSNMEMNNKEISDKEINDIIGMLDKLSNDGVSRIKVQMDEEKPEGDFKKEYHHGRCDVGSPWAKGCSFDVLE